MQGTVRSIQVSPAIIVNVRPHFKEVLMIQSVTHWLEVLILVISENSLKTVLPLRRVYL